MGEVMGVGLGVEVGVGVGVGDGDGEGEAVELGSVIVPVHDTAPE